MNNKEKLATLENRIKADLDYFQGQMPEKFAVAWAGYLTALVEWKNISLEDHKKLDALLPRVSNPDPIETILLGRE